MKVLILAFIVLLGFFGCKKNVDLEKKYSLILSYKIGDSAYEYEGNEPYFSKIGEDLVFGFINKTSVYSNMLQATSHLQFATMFSNYKDRDMQISFKIDKDTLLLDSTYKRFKNYNDFKSIFTLGEHPYSDYGPFFEGITINYWEDGVRWFTDKKFGNNQTVVNHSDFYNSSFEITRVEKFFSYSESEDIVRVYANFDITLYNDQSDSLRIDNGSFVMLFGQ